MSKIFVAVPLTLMLAACSFDTPVAGPGGSDGGTDSAGGSTSPETGGSSTGAAPTTGATGGSGSGAEPSTTGGSSTDGGTGAGPSGTGGTGGAAPEGGTGATTGGTGSGGGGSATGGTGATGGSGTSGSGTVGAGGTGGGSGGAPPVGGTAGTGAGGAPAEDLTAVGKPLDGLRVDDPCGGNPGTASGTTCNHLKNPFHELKAITFGGTVGKNYDVTLRIRGIVEVTNITGGTQPDPAKPFNVGGSNPAATRDYQPWLLIVGAQNYYLSQFKQTAHIIKMIDYEVTIPIAGGTKITLDVNDSNDHEISNYARLAPPGVPGSMNWGQFVQIAVVKVAAKP